MTSTTLDITQLGTFITHLESSLDDLPSDFGILRKAELNKASSNLSKIRDLSYEHHDPQFSKRLADIGLKTTEARSLFERDSQAILKHRRRPSLLPASTPVKSSNKNSTEEEKKLSFDTKMSIQSQAQSSISSDILSLVRQIRSDAVAFSEKLAQDSEVLKGTANSLEKSSGIMGVVGGKMNEYRRSTAIGYWFYIWAVLFLVAAIVGGMIVIRLFPKW